jgi:beta-glucosidase
MNNWHVESGAFEILVGASSRDIRLSAKVEVESTQPEPPLVDQEALAVYYDFPTGEQVDKHSFETLLGYAVPDNAPEQVGFYTINTPVSDMDDSFIGRQLANFMKKKINNLFAGQEDTGRRRVCHPRYAGCAAHRDQRQVLQGVSCIHESYLGK